jgi:ATP-dependent protease HslVU (ClpYQ) peptidase subunit
MTCIVGIKTKDNVYMGGDTQGSGNLTGYKFARPKVFKKNNFLFGVCGSWRIMQLLEFIWTPPIREINETTDNYLYTKMPNSVRECLKNNGAIKTSDGEDEMSSCAFLFAFDNRLFTMYSDFCILELVQNYATTGSGMYHAEASLYSTEGIIADPKERIRKAIICASSYVLSVNDKIDIVALNEEKKGKTKSK